MEKERLGNVEFELEEINTLDVENLEDSKQTISGSFTTAICC